MLLIQPYNKIIFCKTKTNREISSTKAILQRTIQLQVHSQLQKIRQIHRLESDNSTIISLTVGLWPGKITNKWCFSNYPSLFQNSCFKCLSLWPTLKSRSLITTRTPTITTLGLAPPSSKTTTKTQVAPTNWDRDRQPHWVNNPHRWRPIAASNHPLWHLRKIKNSRKETRNTR